MTYDGTDPNDDGVVEADVDNQSTTTDNVIFDVLVEGDTDVSIESYQQSGSERGSNKLSVVDAVGTTATEILNYGGNGVLVIATGDDGSTNRFCDILVAARGSSVTVIGSEETNTPPGRTYTEGTGTIELSVSSGTVDVGVWAARMSPGV